MYGNPPGYYYVFGDKINVRSGPDKDSKTVKQLSIGDSVSVVEVTDQQMTLNGIRYPWVKVEWLENRRKQYGFVWGALLSFHREVFQYEDGEKYELYYGVTNYVSGDKIIQGEVRLCKSGKIIDIGGIDLNLWDTDFPVFKMGTYKSTYDQLPEYRNIDHIFSLDLTVESCGPSGQIYVLINKGKLLFSGSELGSFSGGDFSEGNYFVFPWDKGGMKDRIIEYYSYYSAQYEEHEEVDTCYQVQTYMKVDGRFIKD